MDQIPDISTRRDPELIAIDEALKALAALNPRKAQVIELCFFGGLSIEETAEVLKVHEQTVVRDWRLARVWLMREISDNRQPPSHAPPDERSSRGRVRTRAIV